MLRTFNESKLIAARNLKKLLRVPMLLFFSLFQPMLFLVLFSQIFQRLGNTPMFQALGFESYLMFFAPSVLVLTALNSAFQSGMGMVTDIDSGMLDKFLISPIRRSSVLFGKVITDAARIMLQGLIVFLVAFAMGARVETGLPGMVLMLLIVALFGVAWAGLSNIIALRTRNAEMTMMIGILLTFPLLFMSTAMMPPGLLPSWLDTVAKFNPVSYVIDATREFMNFGYDWTQVAQTLGVIAVVGLLTMTGAVRAFRKATT
jgi:ABC-2 type transport system permease protein